MMTLKKPLFLLEPDLGLLFSRLSGSSLVLYVHGIPKLLHWQNELLHIDDPLHMGAHLTLLCALFSEVLCPLLIIAGFWTRLACLPFLFLLLVSMTLVHPEWTIEQGQFGWLLMILFGTIALCGPGKYVLGTVKQAVL